MHGDNQYYSCNPYIWNLHQNRFTLTMNKYKFVANVIVIRRIIKRVTFDISVSGLVSISIVMRFNFI